MERSEAFADGVPVEPERRDDQHDAGQCRPRAGVGGPTHDRVAGFVMSCPCLDVVEDRRGERSNDRRTPHQALDPTPRERLSDTHDQPDPADAAQHGRKAWCRRPGRHQRLVTDSRDADVFDCGAKDDDDAKQTDCCQSASDFSASTAQCRGDKSEGTEPECDTHESDEAPDCGGG